MVKIHGDRWTRLYRIWQGMKTRCTNPNCKDYKDYGARGINVCEEWSKSYVTFKEWALTHGYKEDLTIERINVDDGYKPDNCKFITNEEQSYNKRNTVYYTHNGLKLNCLEWEKITGIKRKTLQNRKYKGWTDEELLTIPLGGKRNGRKKYTS